MLCSCGQCRFNIQEYENNNSVHTNNNRRRRKAGVIIHNTKTNHLLIIQSRGNMWGFPKGSMEEDETFIDCAIRELKEETSIDIDKKELTKEYKLNTNIRYYYVETSTNYDNLVIPKCDNNDASGMCWIKLECLKELFINKKITLNYHARNCLFHFFKIGSRFKF